VKAPKSYAKAIAGLRPGPAIVEPTFPEAVERLEDDDIVCRCERVKAGEIRARIREGYRDINELKAVTRAGMGACGGKTCTHLIHRIFREMGIPSEEVTEGTSRPLFVEVPLGRFAGARSEE
jgi:NAD(P)H-nitrite reductase large subunit